MVKKFWINISANFISRLKQMQKSWFFCKLGVECGWGLAAPAYPSATILWLVTCFSMFECVCGGVCGGVGVSMGVGRSCPPVRNNTLAKWPNVEVNMAKINKYGYDTTLPDLSSSVKLRCQNKLTWHATSQCQFFPDRLIPSRDKLENIKNICQNCL